MAPVNDIANVEEGDVGGEEALPAIVAHIENDQVTLADTQLVTEDGAEPSWSTPNPKTSSRCYHETSIR